ncbi:hypothetical protein IPG36_06160 [bacterium]|nr:MAG: hypothetical protein IPG36_06160 [bacterium]
MAFKSLTDDAAAAKADAAKMRTQLSELMTQLREANLARDDAKLAAQKQLAQDESRIREEATRAADERQRLELSAKNKTIEDLQKPSTPRNAKPPKARNNCKARSWNLISSKA